MSSVHRFRVLSGGRDDDADADWSEFCRLIGWQEGPEPGDGYEDELAARLLGDEDVARLHPPTTPSALIPRRIPWAAAVAVAVLAIAVAALWRPWSTPATAVRPHPAPERAPRTAPAPPVPVDVAPAPRDDRDRPHGRRADAPRPAPPRAAPRRAAPVAPPAPRPPASPAPNDGPLEVAAARPTLPRPPVLDPDAPSPHAAVPRQLPFELSLLPDRDLTLASMTMPGVTAVPTWSHLGGAGEPNGRPVAVVDLREASRWLSTL